METIQPSDYLLLIEYVYKQCMREHTTNSFKGHSKILIDLCKKYSVDTIVGILNHTVRKIKDIEVKILKLACGEMTITIESFVQFVYNNTYYDFNIIENDFNNFPKLPGNIESAILFISDKISINQQGINHFIDLFNYYVASNYNIYPILTKLLLNKYDSFISELWFILSNRRNFDDFCKLSLNVLLTIDNNCKHEYNTYACLYHCTLVLVLSIYHADRPVQQPILDYFHCYIATNIQHKFLYKFANINWLNKFYITFDTTNRQRILLLAQFKELIQSTKLSLGIQHIILTYL